MNKAGYESKFFSKIKNRIFSPPFKEMEINNSSAHTSISMGAVPKWRIGIVILYIGKAPWYQQLFLDSCRKNSSIDFLFFSDQFAVQATTENIKQYPFSLEDFNTLATQKLGLQIRVSSGMKLCDFKPAFGLIFEDYLNGYDFWGYSDTDIIFGRLRAFLIDQLLETNDFFSVVKGYPSGFFAVGRNSQGVVNLFRRSQSYQLLFQMTQNTLFDECGGYYTDVLKGKNILETDCRYDTFHHLLERHKDEIRQSFDDRFSEDQSNLCFCDGKIEQAKKEIMMFHLTRFKKQFFLSVDVKERSSDLKLFKYSIRKSNLLSAFVGFFYDHYCALRLNLAFVLDAILRRQHDGQLQLGRFKYMADEIFDVVRNGDGQLIVYKDREHRCCKSIIFKEFVFVEGMNIYLIFSETKIDVLFRNGSYLTFTNERFMSPVLNQSRVV